MPPSLTHAQQRASNPSHSVWVTANAGTGKTKVLTDRVLRLLLNGTSAHKILCLTFTKAAAAEMSARIQYTLSQWSIAEDETLIQALTALNNTPPDKPLLTRARQLFTTIIDDPGALAIQTIHGFCQSLLKRFPLEAGITPHFDVLDEKTSYALLSEAWHRLLTDNDNEQDAALAKAIQHVSVHIHEQQFFTLIGDIINQRHHLLDVLEHHGSPTALIAAIHQELNIQENDSEEQVTQAFCEYSPDGLSSLAEALDHYGNDNDKKRGQLLYQWLNSNPAERPSLLADYISLFLTKESEPKQLKSIATQKVRTAAEHIDSTITKEQDRISRFQEHLRCVKTAHMTESIIHISDALLTLYQSLKDQRASLDYHDLISLTRRLLNQANIAPWIMYKLDGGIDHMLIDEAQDTSPEQWSIISALCSEFFAGEGQHDETRTLFVVGDEKQSIFSFQGADPHAFYAVKRYFADLTRHSASGWHPVAMDLSFRSTAPILQAVDAIFSHPITSQAVTTSEDTVQHQHFRDDPGMVELWPLVTLTEKKQPISPWPLPDQTITPENPALLLANHIADTIRQWLDNGRCLASTGKPITPNDIMILVRRRNSFVDHMVQALKARDVNVAGVDRMQLTDHIAVMDLISLGEWLLLPSDDLTLATILKSPFIGITESELFDLAYDRKDSLWKELQRRQDDLTFHRAYQTLYHLLEKVDFLSPFALYHSILEVDDGRKKCAECLGEEVYDPLDEFLTLAQNYSLSNTPSLQGFLSWLQSGSSEIKRDLEQGNNEVRIMTVHGAKGLQAPIVFLPDTTQTPKQKSGLLWDHEKHLVLFPGRQSDAAALCLRLQERKQQHDYDEYLRLLYVALTRAGDELYIGGWEGGHKTQDTSWYYLIQQGLKDVASEHLYDIQGECKTALRLSTLPEEVSTHINAPNVPESITALPSFITQKAPLETMGMMLSPSTDADNTGKHFSPSSHSPQQERGILYHRLLQLLPHIPTDERADAIAHLISHHPYRFSDTEQADIQTHILTLLDDPQFAALCSPESQAEIPVTGMINGHYVSGQIDRLVVRENSVLIVDFKTQEHPPASHHDIPPRYLQQMSHYRQLIQPIYPQHSIECALLWTSNLKMMYLEETLLHSTS